MKSHRFFGAIVDGLNAVQANGLIINGIRLKFSFSTLVADNLAAHQLGGFQTSFSSGYFCRRCHIVFNDRTLPSFPPTAQWRTAVHHDHCLNQIRLNPMLHSLFGVVGPSVFEQLDGFHSTTSLPADCMHDFFEGSCPHVIMLLLKEASASRLITYRKATGMPFRFFSYEFSVSYF